MRFVQLSDLDLEQQVQDRHQPQHLDLDPCVGSHVQVDVFAPVQDILLSTLEQTGL